MGLFLRKNHPFKLLGLTFSYKLDWSSDIISVSKTASKKIGALICSVKFLFPEVALYLYKSTIQPCVGYCCHVWAGEERICRTVGPSLAASLESLAHPRNVANLSLFHRYYFGRCSSELAELIPLAYFRWRPTRYSDRMHDFSVTIPNVTRLFISTVYFLAQLDFGILCL